MTTTETPLPIALFNHWLRDGNRGLSSEAIVERLTGVPVGQRARGNHPYDPSDFRRCELLLRAVPLARLSLDRMRDVSPVWARLVDEWEELVALGESEVPGAYDHPAPDGTAPLLYARLKEIRETA